MVARFARARGPDKTFAETHLSRLYSAYSTPVLRYQVEHPHSRNPGYAPDKTLSDQRKAGNRNRR